MIAVYSLFIFKPELLSSYCLDFIGATVILVLDLAIYIAQLVSYFKNGFPNEGDAQKIAPEPTQEQRGGKRMKKNTYDVNLNDVDN